MRNTKIPDPIVAPMPMAIRSNRPKCRCRDGVEPIASLLPVVDSQLSMEESFRIHAAVDVSLLSSESFAGKGVSWVKEVREYAKERWES